MRIPIANIYFLLLYAWDILEEAELVDVTPDESTDLLDLFARVLTSGLHHLARRGIRQDYVASEEEVRGIRGRLLVEQTLRRHALAVGTTICEVDQLTPNIKVNRVLRSTLRLLLEAQLDRKVHDEVAGIYRRLSSIDCMRLTTQAVARAELERQPPFYRFLLSVCNLVVREIAIRAEQGDARFRGFDDTELLAQVFERFLFNFYRREQTEFAVNREQVRWYPAFGTAEDLGFLPAMHTDVFLASSSRRIVIDAKFYAETLRPGRYGDKKKVREEHLYQMFAYLSNVRSATVTLTKVEGLLLYPKVDETVSVELELHGLRLRVETLDLTAPSKAIRERLLKLIA